MSAAASTFAAVFAALYAGHMVGDHVAQTDHQAAHKADQSPARDTFLPDPRGYLAWRAACWEVRRRAALAMAGHLCSYFIAQWLAVGALLLLDLPLSSTGLLAAMAFSVATHGFIDRRWPVRWLLEHTGSRDFVKLGSPDGPQIGLNGPYLTDQALHIGCLFIAAWLAAFLSGGAG